jgi:hypothetical protein
MGAELLRTLARVGDRSGYPKGNKRERQDAEHGKR